MARPTIASLTQQLNAANQEVIAAGKALEAARLRISILEGELALRPALPVRRGPRVVEPRAAWVRPAHLEAARQLAMRTGACVRVAA